MSANANVYNIDVFLSTIKALLSVEYETKNQCAEGLNKAEEILQQTQEEFKISNGMLDVARVIEAEKLAEQLAADARMAKALAEEAAAIASGNPIAIAAATTEVAVASQELCSATEEHRERLEHRVELAQRCVGIAEEMVDTLRLRFNYSQAKISKEILEGNGRLQNAYNDLSTYLSRISSVALKEISDFYKWKPEEKKPVTPGVVHDRLNASSSVNNAILEYLYVTDFRFRFSVDRLCIQLKTPGNEASVEIKIKKNIVGRLCEELVIRCFSPMGEKVETQGIYYLENGTYTKADMILYGLKEPLILGCGEGMAAPAGGNLGIEVKSGKKEYIFDQLSHMEKQAKGHRKCDLSCAVCSRDIKDLPPEKEQILRSRLRDAGSPILGMLPRKSELDKDCIDFVKAKAKNNV